MKGLPGASLVSIATVCLLATLTSGQRTYRRSCECEYTENGKCAYTLLLPTMQGDNQQCPIKDENEKEAMDPDMEMAFGNLTATVEDLSRKMTELSLNSGDQSRMLSQLQSKVMDITDGLQFLQGQVTPSNDSCEQCAQLEARVQHNSNATAELQSMLDGLRMAINETQLQFTELYIKMQNMQNNTEELLSSFNSNINDTFYSISSELNQISNMNIAYNLCMRKGLLISGSSSRIENEAISASTEEQNTTAEMGRLRGADDPSAWCPEEPNSDEEWIQFDLGVTRVIYGVVTKGRADYAQWVQTYTVQYGDDGHNMTTVTNVADDVEIFMGNEDQNTAKTNMFWQPVMARYIRFVPLTSYEDRNKCLRADVIGCLDT